MFLPVMLFGCSVADFEAFSADVVSFGDSCSWLLDPSLGSEFLFYYYPFFSFLFRALPCSSKLKCMSAFSKLSQNPHGCVRILMFTGAMESRKTNVTLAGAVYSKETFSAMFSHAFARCRVKGAFANKQCCDSLS
jgi:hypothetical protein